jgi:prepilin-type N-terminal cleavage/methylation domain-containing protein
MRRRSGYTLFEVVLVMAVVVIISAIAYPSLKSMYGPYKLNGAIDTVRAAWANARARAIEEGRPYRFSVEPGGSHFRVAPDRSDYWGGSVPSNDPQGKALVYEEALPAGVRFSLNENPSPASDPDEKEKPASGNWSTGAVFLPDGTARDDLKITFQVRGTQAKVILLRGLTGNVSVQTVKQ